MILLKCNDCSHEFQVLRTLSKIGCVTVYNKQWQEIKCEKCNVSSVSRVEVVSDGFPALGTWSAQNDYAKTSKSMAAAKRLNDARNKENGDFNHDNNL